MLALKVAHTAELNTKQEENDAKIRYLQDQIARFQRDIDNLWEENARKGRLIDRLIEQLDTVDKT
jgi:peptidoglycan hydrolase CwlO-like protein